MALNGTSYHENFTAQNIKKWIEGAGGHAYLKEKLTEQTTHVVINEKTWLAQGPFIQEILRAERKETSEQQGRAIHIVSFNWLDDTVRGRKKLGESNFKWKKLAPVRTDAEREQQAGEEKQPGNTQGLMAQAFLDSTDTFVGRAERKRIEKRKRQEAEDQADILKEEQQQFQDLRKRMSVPEQAAVFHKGAKRGRCEILSGGMAPI